jgi:hypothetical protein
MGKVRHSSSIFNCSLTGKHSNNSLDEFTTAVQSTTEKSLLTATASFNGLQTNHCTATTW